MLSKLFTDFFNSEKAGGFILIGCTILSLLVANSAIGENYIHFWHQQVGFQNESVKLDYPVEVWINDGLMTIFFVLVGLEIERELYAGELSTVKSALLPLFAAIGGMIIPALIHYVLNVGTATQGGLGIPMATDIAFALGILSLLGNRIPIGLKIFLTAFAIIDDLGAIIVIAIFYTKSFAFGYFAAAIGIWLLLFIMNRLKVQKLTYYIFPGIIMWYCMLQSGVHATISGILFAFALPFGNGDAASPSYRLQHYLHKPVAFLILPIFALANTCVLFSGGWSDQLISKNSLGIGLGLIVGKPVGIFLFAFAAVKLKLCELGAGVNWKLVLGAAMLGGIGFTMSIFITLLAFDDPETISSSKIAVLFSSCIAGLIGYFYLKMVSRKKLKGV